MVHSIPKGPKHRLPKSFLLHNHKRLSKPNLKFSEGNESEDHVKKTNIQRNAKTNIFLNRKLSISFKLVGYLCNSLVITSV